MQIPPNILAKTNKFRGKTNRIIEEGWNYLQSYFRDENDYFNFLGNLSDDKFEQFLHTTFFYLAHDLYRITKKEVTGPNIDGFMYQITLSMVEYLNKNVSNFSKRRIEDFFTKYFSDFGKTELKNEIRARAFKNAQLLQTESWEVLYEMRNNFIHRAKWFVMRFGDGFASLSTVERRDGSKYLADIRLKFVEYLKLFWEAYLKYFGKETDS